MDDAQPTIVPGHKNADGYWVAAKSSCCRDGITLRLPWSDRYESWSGITDIGPHDELRCARCNRELAKGER